MRFLLIVLVCACGPTRPPDSCFKAASNAPSCPVSWAEARAWCTDQRACTGDGGCSYPGMGDLRSDAQCPSDAVIGCFQGVWRCGQ